MQVREPDNSYLKGLLLGFEVLVCRQTSLGQNVVDSAATQEMVSFLPLRQLCVYSTMPEDTGLN